MRKSFLTKAVFGLASAATMLMGTYASAATITWGAATTVNFTGVTDFSTSGSFYDSATINPDPSYTIATSPSILMHRRDAAAGANPFSFIGSSFISGSNNGSTSLSTQFFPAVSLNDYMRVLSYGTQGTGTLSLTISGLTPGWLYQVQVWTPFWNQDEVFTKFTAGNSVILKVGEGLTGSTQPITTNPQFAIGTFTAIGTTQVITFTRTDSGGTPTGGSSFFGAMQVRLIPEPGSLGMMIIGLVGFARILRQRRLHG